MSGLMALQAALMAAMFAELMPWLITRYLGEISYTQDRASRGGGRTWLSRASQEGRIESVLDCVFSWVPALG